MRCAVTRDEYGNILDVVSQNGNQSKLYFDLLFQLNDPELALKEYALTFTKSFNDSMGSAVRDNNGEHTIDTYNRYNQGGVGVIKEGVEELFNSNPKLANAIYDTLVPKGYTRLYRAENEKGVDSPAPSWLLEQPEVTAQKEAEGRWFYKSYEEAKDHADKFGSSGISYIDVPINEVEKFNAKDNKFAGGYGREGREYFVSKELATDRKPFEQQKQQALQLYSQYLDTIFPDSKVKDIVYRGQDGKEKISKNNTQGSKQIGIYFSDRWKNAKFYATTQTKSEKGDVIAVLLDIKNPAIDTIKNFGNLNEKPQNVDGIISTTSLEKVVFEPEQIHILGGKQDIQGFTNYVKGGVQPTTLDIPTELGFRDLTTDEYYQLDEDNLANQYASQLENATVEQKKAFDAISKMHNSVYKEVVGDDVNTGKPMYAYTMKDALGNDVTLKSVTTTLNENPRYSFDGTNTEDTFINWGNTADIILSGIVEGKTIEQIEKQLSVEFPLIDVNEIMTQDAREQLYKLFTEYVNEQKSKGNVILTQIRHGNLNKKIGGTADIIIVLPDGRVQYADLKTSYKPFVGTDSTFKREFKKSPISIKASKFERYSAQLSTYAAIGTHNGLTVDITNPINILPIYLKTEDKTAIDAELQTEENNTYYIKGKYMQNIVTEYSSRYTSNTFKDIFSKMLSALYRAKDTFTKAGDIDKANEIGQLIKDLDNTEFYSGITNIVNNAYELFVGRKDSLYKVLNSLLSTEVTADNVSEVLNTINEIESLIDLYHPANENSALQQLSRQLREQNIIIEDESFASKLREVIGTIADMREGIKDKLPSMLAEYLVTAIPANANDNIIKQYEAKLKKLKVISGREGDRNKRKTKELEKEIEDFQLQYNITDNNGKLQPDLKAMLEREIKDGGYKDITTLDRYISSAVQMPVGFLATFAIKLKTALEEARQLAIDFQYKANDAFNEFMKDRSFQQPEKLYEGMYYNKEVYGRDEATGKYVKKNNVLGLVSIIDYNAFNQAKAKMYEEASLIEDNGDRSVFIANWYKDNTQQRPDEDIKANGVTLVESINTVYKRKRLKLGSDSDRFKAWEALNTFIDKDGTKRYVGELQIPNLSKYKSKDFEKLSQDKSKFKLYTFALQTYFESQSLQPARSTFDYEEYKYIAPYIMKSSMDRLTDNGFKSLIRNKIDDVYKRLDDDMNEHGYDPNTKSIHVLYYNSANPVKYDDASKDLMNTILRYKIAADRYAKRKEVGVIGDALLSRVRNTNPLQVDDAGNSISEKLNNRITGFLDKKLKSKGNNAADLLEAFIEAQIYGITRKDSKLNGIDLNKLTDNFMSFAAFTQLGLDVTLAVSNSLTANITTAIDAAGKRVYGVGAWAKASGKYWTYEKDFISDAMNPVKKSLIGQLVDIYDPMQGDFVDNYGRKIGKGVVKAKWNSSQAFTGMRKGEHRAQVTAMIAALSETKVKYTNPTTGEVSMISLIDAYEIPVGQTRIQLKQGVELSKQVGLVDINVQNTLHSVNTSLHGIYNSFEAPDISRHWLGRLLQMYRKYLPAGLKYRYKREGFNYQLGDFTEGTYASFYGTLVSDWRELVRALQGKETYLSDVEVANLRRALAEQAVVLSTGLLVIALQAALEGEDDDEKDAAKWLLYTALRLNQEIALYGAALNPLSYGIPSYRPLWKTFTNVSAITTLGDKVVKLMGSALGDSVNIITGEDIERYERDAGLFEKGDSKTLANFLKLLGINNRKLLQDPEDAVNLLILEKGAGG